MFWALIVVQEKNSVISHSRSFRLNFTIDHFSGYLEQTKQLEKEKVESFRVNKIYLSCKPYEDFEMILSVFEN